MMQLNLRKPKMVKMFNCESNCLLTSETVPSDQDYKERDLRQCILSSHCPHTYSHLFFISPRTLSLVWKTMQRVSYQQPSSSSSAAMGGGNSPRSFTLRELTSTMPLIITPSTMIPPQIAPSSTAAASSSNAEPAANMGNIASSSTTTTTTITTSSANDFSSIEMLSIFRGHVPMNCAVPADRTARMMVMKMFAKKVQHSKSFLSFVKMQFDGQGVKLWEALLTDDHQQRQQQQPQEEEENALPLEIKGTAIDLVRLSKRDATFFYFTTRNAWSDTSTDSGVRSPLLNYPLGERSSLSGYDVFAFHATSPRTAERCFRLLQQFAEMNAASEQLMVKFGGGKVPGSSSSGGFFHMAGSLLSTPSLVAAVADASSNTSAHTASVNKTTTIITNHNNNNITLPFASHCDLGNPTKSAKSSSLKSILSGGGGNGGKGEPREEHHVTFVSGLETNRRSEEEGPSPPFQSSQPPSADLLLLCDFNSGADQQKQHSASSMSDLFDDLVGSSSGRQAPPSSAGGKYQAANCEGDLLDDYSTSPLPKTAFTPVQQSQYFSQAPPPQRRPIQPQQLQQQPILVPTNPFAAPAPASAPVYSNFGVLNPFASVPLQPQPAVAFNGASGQSFCGGQPPAGKSLNTSAFSTDFNDFLQQTVKGHFKG